MSYAAQDTASAWGPDIADLKLRVSASSAGAPSASLPIAFKGGAILFILRARIRIGDLRRKARYSVTRSSDNYPSCSRHWYFPKTKSNAMPHAMPYI